MSARLLPHNPAGRVVIAGAVVTASLVAIAGRAVAQDARRTLPPPMTNDRAASSLPANAPTTRPGSDEKLIPELKLLVIHAHGEAAPALQPAQTGVAIGPVLLADRAELQRDLQAFVGKPLSMNDLNRICDRIVAEYRLLGRPVVDAVLPEQDATDGTVRVEVVEAKFGKARVEEVRSDAIARRAARTVRLTPGGPIDADTLLEDLDWLNRRSPFQSYELLFQRGQRPVESDVVLKAMNPGYPLRVFTTFDNTGSDATGNDRLVAGCNWGDAFGLGLDQQLSYQFTADDEFRRFSAHGLTYTVPLEWRHLLSFSGTWSRSTPDFAEAGFDSSGESWQISTRYEIPLRRSKAQRDKLEHSVIFGADFKRSNSNLEFGGETVFDRAAETVQFIAQYRFDARESDGRTFGNVQLVASPGFLSSGNNEAAYDVARRGAEPTYAYVSASLDRRWQLENDFAINVRTQAQVGTGPLLSAEQFGIGGVDSVRGYPERGMNADSGVQITFEVESPALKPLTSLGVKNVQEDLRLFLFADAAAGWNYSGDEFNPSAVHAVSVGPGARYRVSDFGSVEASYGFRLDDEGLSDEKPGRFHFQVSASFAW